MKKSIMIIIAAALIISSCAELKRANPTDPEASNYEGLHYKGSITGFSGIYDICTDAGKTYTSDSSKRVFCHLYNGDMEWNFGETVFNAPVSVCATGVTLAVADTGAGNYLRFFDLTTFGGSISYFDVSAPYVPGKIRSNGNNFFVTAPQESKVYVYDMHLSNFLSPQSFGTPGTGDGQFLQISDIQVTAGEVFVADSQTGKISVFSASAPFTFLRAFNTFAGIKGFIVKNLSVLVPSSAGLKEYNHLTGAPVKTYANYGQGNGKVTKPSWAGINGDMILIENNTEIKEFIP